jgi:hypothetical protein
MMSEQRLNPAPNPKLAPLANLITTLDSRWGTKKGPKDLV